jgi:hypothetical protein
MYLYDLVFYLQKRITFLKSSYQLIWSAAVASCQSMGLYDSVSLLAKDEKGDIVHWSPSGKNFFRSFQSL